MGTGTLSQQQDFPRNGFPLLGTAACLIVGGVTVGFDAKRRSMHHKFMVCPAKT